MIENKLKKPIKKLSVDEIKNEIQKLNLEKRKILNEFDEKIKELNNNLNLKKYEIKFKKGDIVFSTQYDEFRIGIVESIKESSFTEMKNEKFNIKHGVQISYVSQNHNYISDQDYLTLVKMTKEELINFYEETNKFNEKIKIYSSRIEFNKKKIDDLIYRIKQNAISNKTIL